MKEKIIRWLCEYSFRITAYIFGLYSLLIIALDFFDKEINKIATYTFWLLLGFYLGFAAAFQVAKYMRMKKGN